MKKTRLFLLAVSMLAAAGCSGAGAAATRDMRIQEKKTKPTFMFWCFRKEIVAVDYHIPAMKKPAAAAYIQSRLKGLPGHQGSTYDLDQKILTVNFQSSTIRKMNVEEAIALAGFAVNHRPAHPKAKIPPGVN